MRRLFVLFSLSTLFLGFALGGDGGAVVIKDGAPTFYGFSSWHPGIDEGYQAFGAGDWEGIYGALNLFLGCDYETGPSTEELERQTVDTPSGNFSGSIHGPMIHAVWDPTYQDPCTDEPMTWGYGSYTGMAKAKPNKGFSLHITASGMLPDSPDMCEGDLIDYSTVFFMKEDGSVHPFHINLECPE
jgi:hypothetical protein